MDDDRGEDYKGLYDTVDNSCEKTWRQNRVGTMSEEVDFPLLRQINVEANKMLEFISPYRDSNTVSLQNKTLSELNH